MTKTHFMASVSISLPKALSNNPVLLSESFDKSSSDSQQYTRNKRHRSALSLSPSTKKPRTSSLNSFLPEDMHKFLTCSQKEKFSAFKNYSIVPDRIIHFCQLKDAFCNDPIRIFYANLLLFLDSGELKTLVLGTRITLNDFMSEKVFDTKFSSVISFMNDTWPEDFEKIKDHFKSIEEGVMLLQESTFKLLDLGKSTNTNDQRINNNNLQEVHMTMGFDTEGLEEEAPMTMGFKTNEASSSSDALKIPEEDDPFLGQKLQHLSSPLKTFANVFMSLRKLELQSEAVKISSFGDLRFAVCGSVGRIVVDAMGNSENGNSTRPLFLHPLNTVPQQPDSTIQKIDFRFNQI
ncbi:hypothetical protein FXO37_17317 [Capsicum annuum]|nr:hypothetical protein FXO37_17317 [Capsicum annuum]